MENFKMDRNVAYKLTFEEADDHVTFYKDKTPLERLQYACDLIYHVFQTSPMQKIDKTVVYSRKNAKHILS